MEWIIAERDRYEGAGMLREFMQERMLAVDSEAAKPFSEDMIRAVDIAPSAWLPRIAIYDPSRTASVATSDRTGKVVVSRYGSRIIVHESGGYFWKPDEIRADVFACAERHHVAEVAIEKNSLDEFLLQPIRYEMLRRGVALQLRPLQAPQDRDKEAFIMGLQAFFKAGDILLVGGRGMHAQLVAEILNFPGGRLDILNALAYALRVFSGEPVYQDFGEANIAPAAEPRLGERVFACWNASASETVCVALTKEGRSISVAADWAKSGPITDAVKDIAASLRARFPGALVQAYLPAELHDQWTRIALAPALREARLTPWRGEAMAVARGALAEPMRTVFKTRRALSVDARATLTLAALAGGYKYPIGRSGAPGAEPEAGLSRLVAEAIEVAVAWLARGFDESSTEGHYATNPQGFRFRSALPQRR